MITLIIGNSYSRIEGLSTIQFKKLRKLLSYPDEGYINRFRFPQPKYLIDMKGNFPSGLYDCVKSFLEDEKLIPTIIPMSIKPPPSLNDSLFRRLVSRMEPKVAQQRALLRTKTSHRGIISMPTGSGKSYVIALIAARLNVKTLVVVPTLEIKKQLIADMKRYYGGPHKITIENIDSSALNEPNDYDCLIIDEAHHVAAKTYQKLNKTNWNGIYYRYFLTATPFRNQKHEILLFEGIAGSVIYEYTYIEAVVAGDILPVEAYYIELPKVKTLANTWASVYSQLVVNNLDRNKIIALLLNNLFEKSTLCLVKEVKHGNNIKQLYDTNFANGQDDESRKLIGKFNSTEIKTLIGTTGLLGEGIDSKPCEYVIIAGLGKAKSAFMQQIGRGLRTYPGKESCKIILFKDKSHRFLLNHFRAQVKILKEYYGITPQKLELE